MIPGSWVVEAPKRRLEAAMSAASKVEATQIKYNFGDVELSVYGE